MKLFIKQTITTMRRVPLPVYIGVGVLLLAVAYFLTFILPTNVQFSYSSKSTCTSWVTVAPRVHQQRAGKDELEITLEDEVVVFGVPLFSRTTCVTPVVAPESSRAKVSIAPFGLPLFSKTFGVNMPDSPKANVVDVRNAEISAIRPLTIPLSTKDVVYTYTVHEGKKSADCASSGEGLECEIEQLELTPSTPYDLELRRSFNGDETKKLEEIPVRTLNAVQVVESSLKNGMTIYDTPKEFTYTFDRDIDAAEGTLRLSDGDKTVVAVTLSTKGAVLTVTPETPLERDRAYVLQLDQVAGVDGASLAKPLKTAFTLSGGPKVTGVSVGSSNVAQNATITVTFDQPLKEDVAIEKFARSTGIGSAVAIASKNSITFRMSSAALCSAFSLVIDKDIPSGSNEALSAEAWRLDSRITCGYSSVIGYSVNGRAIISYTFGSGAKTLLFTGGMHGSEPSGMSTMQAWVNYLQSYGYQIPADKKVVIVPNTNPDGIATGARYNANDVNIDRNFPSANWRPDIDTATGLLPTGGGTSAGSEPETKALIALTRQLRPRLEVSFHAQGSLLGANQYGDSTVIANRYGATVGYGSMIGNAEEVMGYSITGEYEDWMGEEMGIPAILIELPTQYGNYLSSQLTALLNLLKI